MAKPRVPSEKTPGKLSSKPTPPPIPAVAPKEAVAAAAAAPKAVTSPAAVVDAVPSAVMPVVEAALPAPPNKVPLKNFPIKLETDVGAAEGTHQRDLEPAFDILDQRIK